MDLLFRVTERKTKLNKRAEKKKGWVLSPRKQKSGKWRGRQCHCRCRFIWRSNGMFLRCPLCSKDEPPSTKPLRCQGALTWVEGRLRKSIAIWPSIMTRVLIPDGLGNVMATTTNRSITAQIRPKWNNIERSFNIRWNFSWHELIELDINLRDEFQDQERVHQCRMGRRRGQ